MLQEQMMLVVDDPSCDTNYWKWGRHATQQCMLIDNSLMDMKQRTEVPKETCNKRERERGERGKNREAQKYNCIIQKW